MPAEHQRLASGEFPMASSTLTTPETTRRRFAVPLWREALVCLLLAAATGGVYSRACRNGFVNYDDDVYVEYNPEVQKGLTAESVRWAFTTTLMVNWHPLTWLSFQLDHRLFGLQASGFHLTNVVLHVLDTLLLFVALRALTGAVWRSGFVAALFALHPLHVESVAWISERKDTLSTFFWMLTLVAYAVYARRPGVLRYPLVAVPFALGLMAKSMLVTLPFVLLLLDYWPLGRLRPAFWPCLRLLLEKLPLLVLAAASCAVTVVAQQRGGETNPATELPLRLEHAVVSYVLYIDWTVWPQNLIPFHQFPTQLFPPWQVGGAVTVLAAISGACLVLARRAPYLIVGWLWYLGTLVPVIGLVQVLGGHGMADRYTYVPLTGLFLMAVWGVADLAARWRLALLPATVGLVVLAACAVATWVQIGYWYDSTTLWTHALEVDPNNYLGNNNLGTVLLNQGKVDEAMRHYEACLRVVPGYALAHYNMGCALAEKGRTQEAIWHCRQAIAINPHYPDAHNNLGALLLRQGDADGAMREFQAALADNAPNPAMVHNNLGLALMQKGRLPEAAAEFEEALRINPAYTDARNNLTAALRRQGKG
jgi:Tfp pilus assembly protein PilF